MCCGWIIFCYFLATVFTESVIKGNPSLPDGACSPFSRLSLKQCGDDFVDASLCLKCGCCVEGQGPSEMNSTPCYIPPRLPYTRPLSANCTRSLKSLLGWVLLLNDGPSLTQSPVTFYVLLGGYSPRLQTSLRASGSSAVPKLLPFSRDAKNLPRQVKKQFEDLKRGAEPFFFSYATVTYPLPNIYNVQLLIKSHDGLESLSFESNVSVTNRRDILPSAVLRSAVLVNQGPYNVGEESILAVVLDDIHPLIELSLDFGDDSGIARRGGLSFLLGALLEKPGYACLLPHRYSSGGEYSAEAILIYPDIQSSTVRLTTTVRIRCSFPRVEATGGSVSKIGAMQKKRNETLIFHIWVIQDCTDQPVVTQWSLFLVDRGQNVFVNTNRSQTNESEVKFQPYSLAYGLYVLNITGMVPYHNRQKQLVVTELLWFEVVPSRPEAIIDGPLLAGESEKVTFNSSRSYDPDVSGHSRPSLLNYTWYCLTGQWNVTMIQQQAETAFARYEGRSCFYPGCLCQRPPDTPAYHSFLMTWPNESYYRQTIPAIYSVALRLHTFGSRSAYAVQAVMFFSDKSSTTTTRQVTVPMTSQVTVPIQLLVDKIPDVDITCLSNCFEHVDHTKPLVLYAHCRNCILHEPLTYEWDFQSANASFTLKRIDWTSNTLTGNSKASLIVNAKTFESITEDESYQFFVTVTRQSGKFIKVGFSFYFAKYNTDYSIGASKDKGTIGMEQQLHIFLIALFALNFEWV